MKTAGRRRILILPVCMALAYASPLPAAAGQDAIWPQFRGPLRNGVAAESHLLNSWPTNGPPLLWAYTNCGSGYAGVAVAGGSVLTAGTFSNGTRVVALASDGSLRWTAQNGTGRWRVPPGKSTWAVPYGGTRSTPSACGGRVIHLDVLGRLAAFDMQTGRELWAVELPKAFGGVCNEWGYSESPLVDGDRLYCLPGGKQGFLVCLDAASGSIIWACNEIPDTKASNASCILAEIGGVRQIVTMTTLFIVGVRAKDGRLLWQARHANRFRENCEVPQYAGGVLYVSSGYGHGSEGYSITPPAGTNQWAATQLWRQNQADNLHGGPIIVDGCVYGAGYDRRGAFCLDLATGAFKWRNQAIGRSSYVLADELLYRLGEDGILAIERPNPRKHDPISSFRLPSAGASICLTHPVVCGGRLYVRHQQTLYCYNVADDRTRAGR